MTRRKAGPQIAASKDHDGEPIYLVQLSGDSGRTARIYPEDYLRLQALGAGRRWHWNSDGQKNAYVRAYRRCPETGELKKVVVARLIANATKGQAVIYRDHDSTNLRRENLQVIAKADHVKAVMKRQHERQA